MGAVGNLTSYVLDLPTGHTTTTCLGREIEVAKVEWRTYIHEGQAYRLVIAFDKDHDNRGWDLDHGQIPEWVPRPPQAWLDLADEIAAQAMQS